MRRLLVIAVLLFGVFAAPTASAQTSAGTPPLLDRITVVPASAGKVTILGASGAVPGGAYVAARNLYTGEVAYDHAGATGSFSLEIAGDETTPYWISPYTQETLVAGSGSLPGGPGVILYNVLANRSGQTPTPVAITIDGALNDWGNYPAAQFNSDDANLYAMRSAASLYLGFPSGTIPGGYTQVEVRFTIDTQSYAVALNPRQGQTAALERTNPSARQLDSLIVAARQAAGLELRIPLTFTPRVNRLTLDSVRWLDSTGGEIASESLGVELPALDAVDGIARPLSDGTSFTVAGTHESQVWSADGQISTLTAAPGDSITIQMNLTYGTPNLPADTSIVGEIALQPIARRAGNEMRAVSGVGSNNGWSSVLTAAGLAVDNLESSIPLGQKRVQPYSLIRGANSVQFPLDFTLNIPRDLPPGLYVPYFGGAAQAADGSVTAWTESGAHLPLVINVGGVTSVRLPWALLADSASDGTRGVLALEDQNEAALSNRVRFNAPTYILTPFKPGTRDAVSYALEPYLLNQLGNTYTSFNAPLIPFQFPGKITARVTRPDGTVDDLGTLTISQNRLSTDAPDERALFGAQSPLDEYRLTTLDAKLGGYQFKQYGTYTINLSGGLNDAWGNRYDGGGTYKILAAELLDLTPGTMFGTPFQVGDSFNAGLHLAPGYPADVTVTVRIYPLDGSAPVEHRITGTANAHGYFQPADARLVFDQPGEYVADYEARFRDSDGRLWAASARGAGVIASVAPTLVAHGQRGQPGVADDAPPAWFDAEQYAQNLGLSSVQSRLYYPYNSGDVAWINDGRNSLFLPSIRAQDTGSGYAGWLRDALPDLNIERYADRGDLPVLTLDDSRSYTYVSAVRPNVTVRQFVAGGESGGLTLGWDEDDPLNGQIGAGAAGNAPGDVIFLFGGAVVRAGDVQAAAGYGAVAVVTNTGDTQVFPPDRGAAGSGDGGALITLNGQSYDAFINLTGVQPGDVVAPGDTVALAGQVAPALEASVTATFTSPSGDLRQYTGKTNRFGYFYDLNDQFTVDEPGVWTVDVLVTQDGLSSAGQSEPPYPQGGVLGAQNGRFLFYVVPPDAEPLDWNPRLKDTIIPILSPYNFSFTLPDAWSGTRVYYTLATPGLIIEQGSIPVSGRSFSYSYSETTQNTNFPNLEAVGDTGAAQSDTRTLTFVAVGVDVSGQTQIRSRTFTLMHDRLITTE